MKIGSPFYFKGIKVFEVLSGGFDERMDDFRNIFKIYEVLFRSQKALCSEFWIGFYQSEIFFLIFFDCYFFGTKGVMGMC